MSDTVTIYKREFRIGATYAPRHDVGAGRGNRTFLGIDQGRVAYQYRGQRIGRMKAPCWAEWAGVEIAP